LFDVGEVAFFGVLGAVFLSLDFPVSPIVLGFVLGPMLEENFRRALLISRGDLTVFIQHPISAWFIGASALLILAQLIAYARRPKLERPPAHSEEPPVELVANK
jgi:putative tricarboxylic transport membrane protein